jgi:hypothetical protein
VLVVRELHIALLYLMLDDVEVFFGVHGAEEVEPWLERDVLITHIDCAILWILDLLSLLVEVSLRNEVIEFKI